MLVRSEYDIQFHLPAPAPMIALLQVHPSVRHRLRTPDQLTVEHIVSAAEREGAELLPVTEYTDSFGNLCSRFAAPAGAIRLSGTSVMEAPDERDLQGFGIGQTPIEELPAETLQFLLASRYCQVDQFGGIAQDLFGL